MSYLKNIGLSLLISTAISAGIALMLPVLPLGSILFFTGSAIAAGAGYTKLEIIQDKKERSKHLEEYDIRVAGKKLIEAIKPDKQTTNCNNEKCEAIKAAKVEFAK